MMLNIKFEQKVTFLIPVTWVVGLHYMSNMLVILYIVQLSDDHKMLIKLKRNKMFEEYQFDRLHFKQTPLTSWHLLPAMFFKHKVFHCSKAKCPCQGRRDVTLNQLSFAKETSLQKQSTSLALWIWTYGKGSVHVNVQCGKGLGQRAFCASWRISVSASRAKGFHVQRDKTQGE